MATETSLKVRLLNASKTHAEWTAADPVLKKGEIAYSSDKKQIRVGDGSSKWSQLSYIDAGHIVGLSNSGSTITYTKADGSTGTITLPTYTLPVATSSVLGGVKSGTDIAVDANGNVSVVDNSHNHTIANVTNLQTTLDSKAPLASPEFTGTPKAPTANAGTNSTQIATTAFVQNAVGDIELGGRNLITGINPTTITTRTIASSSSGNYVEGITYTITTISGCDTYTASFDAKADADGTVVHCYWYSPNTTTKGKSSTGGTFSSANGSDGNCTITLTTEWKRYWVTWTQNATTEVSKHLILGRITKPSSGTSTCYYRAPKFEVGNVATDWTPAPEDLVSSISLSGSTLSYKNPIGTQLGSYTLTKSTVGLGNVDNTSDANKPISTATQTALDQITNSIGNAKLFTGTCSTAAGTAEKDVTCASFKATDLVKGTRISVYFENTNSANIANLKLDVNGTGAKPIKHIYNGSYANIPGAGYLKAGQIYTFTYDGTNWVVEMMYNSNTTPAYLEYRNNTYAKKAIAANRWIVGDKDGYEEIASGVTFDLSYPILYTNGAVSQGSSNYANMFMQFYDLNLGNIKSGFTSSAKKMIYLIVTISGNTATVDSSIITDTLPTSDDGKAYITLGRLGAQSTGANYFLFQAVHPIFVYRKGALRLYSGSADIVNGHTVEADVPSTAVFTDTKVTQTLSSTNANYPLLFGKNTTSTTTNYTDTVLRNNSIYANPSTGIITAPYYTATKAMRVRNQNFSVANTYTNGYEFTLYTGIKFANGGGMPIVHITGFMYTLYEPIDLLINFYMYSGKICNQGVVDRGGWHPNVYIFKYQKGEVDYIAIALTDGNQRNFTSLNADVLDVRGSNNNIDNTTFYWATTSGDAESVIPEPDNGVTCIEVPYRANYNPKPALTVQLNSTTLNTYNGTSTVTMNITKSGLGLGNVENKSSATIRGELTAGNVTTALGYTPLNKAGDSMSGTLTLLGNQYGDSYSSYALNLNNSNIVGVNSIYTADLSDNSQEGIHFYRSSTAVDTLYAKNGVLYFVPNRTLGQTGTSYTILNSNNYTSYTQKVNDGNTSYLFNKGAYVDGSGAKKYLRITLPDNQANVWNMFYMEVSLRQHSPSESGGKILIEAMHNATSPYTWIGFNASVLGYLPSTLTVHASDAKYFYILNNTKYASASLDRILVGDTVRSYDISAVTLDWVDELPETHQDATMYYGIHTGNISAHLNDIYVNRSGDTMTGGLVINPPTGSYNEGVRINQAPSGWSALVLGGPENSTTGAQDTVWGLYTYNKNMYLSHAGSSNGSPRLVGTADGWELQGNRTYINGQLHVRDIRTPSGQSPIILCGPNIVNTNTTLVDDDTTKLTTSTSDSEWIKALLKQICINYPGRYDGIFRGYISPNSVGYYEIYIYNTSDTNETNGLPKYSYGTWRHYAYTFGILGTTSFSPYFYELLNSSNYSSWAVPKTGGTFSGAVTINGNLTIGSGKDVIIPNNYGIRGTLSDGSTSNTWMLYMGSDNKVHLSYGSREVISAGKITSTNGFVGDLTGNVTGTADEAKALITLGDKRNVATTPDDYKYKIVFAGLKAKATVNNPSSDTYSYVIGLRGWNDSSGGKAYEFALNNSGINYRLENTNTTWNSWNAIAHAPNGGVGDAGTPVYMDTDGTLKSISVKNLTSATNLGWVSQANDKTILLNSNVLAYWNGRYSDGASNLAYCNKGAFGTIVTKNTGDYIPISGSTSVTGTIRTTGNLQTRGTAETQIGVGYKTEDTERWFYLWGNNSNGTRGIWDDKKGCVIQTTDTSSHFYGTSDSASALVSASSVTSSSIDDFISVNQLTWAHASSISGVGLSGNDGMVIAMPYSVNSTSYGRQFLLDDDSTKIFTRYRSSNSWKSWDQVLTKSVADGIYASGDFVSKSGDTITGPVVISGSSASLQVEGYGLYVNASDNTIIGDLLFNGSMDLHGDIVQTPTYHITGSFGYAMLTIQNKAISATSNSAITGFTSSHYNDTLFSHSGDTITIKKHGIYRMVIRWHLSSTSSAASVKNVAWAKSGTTTELGWGAVGRANTYETITSEFLQEISASTTLTLIGRSEGGSSTFRVINAWVELVELL